jgi:uncharacterized SAM-binding protein YcdF (DUF218 family)
MRSDRLLEWVGVVVLSVFLLVAFTPLANQIDRWVGVRAGLDSADAIVVLGGGIHSDGVLSERSLAHTLHGITLWRRGLARRLLFSGPGKDGGISEAAARLRLASALGLPAALISADSGGRTTREEARSVREQLAPLHARRILLVTDRRHLLRAREAFEAEGFEVLGAPPPDFLGGAASPQERLQLTSRLVEEFVARGYYHASRLREE